MKKIIVIGAGIAGLSAGIYAQKCGFEVTILESHSIAGGICTSWKRGDYLFEGGMHWLAGSSKDEAANKMWRHTGALNDHVPLSYSEPFAEYDHRGMPIRLYRDVDVTEQRLLELSPADEKEIRRFCDSIRKLKVFADPLSDLRGLKVTKKIRTPLSSLFSLLPVISVMSRFSKVSREEYANRFSHEGIRELLLSIPGAKQGIPMLLLTMGSLARGDGGFPAGGSLPFAGRMADHFASLGGEILYGCRADRVVVENGKAAGVIAGNARLDADAVIIASDTMTMDSLFEEPPKAPWLDEMHKATLPTMVTFISLGVDADLKKYNNYLLFKLEKPISLAEQSYNYLSVSNYANHHGYSPAGKTALTVQLPGDTYDFWRRARGEGRYTQEKQRIADAVISAIAARMPETGGRVEVCDVATPLTYERYCGNWKGSWMTEITPEMKFKPYPPVVRGLGGVYFAGQRMNPPGGLPSALFSGRTAVQYLCRDTDTVFVSEE
jgi:phytoene dehydrogenase-like protein